MTILVTGATGFVGTGLMARLTADSRAVRGASRKPPGSPTARTDWTVVGDQDESTDWRSALHGVRTVVHLAARVYVMRDTAADPFAAFRRTNVASGREYYEEHFAPEALARKLVAFFRDTLARSGRRRISPADA